MATTATAPIVFGPTSGQHLRRRAEDRAAELTASTGVPHAVGWDWVDGIHMFLIVPGLELDPAAN